MDAGYEKERFEKLGIKVSVAVRYRKFCKTLSKSQSMTLLLMLDFFEENGISPQDNLGDTISSLKGQIIKRSNAVIAIIKNIEKIHHKPTTAMLQSLFEETANIEKEDEEDFDFGTPQLITENEELIFYKNAYFKTQEANRDLRTDTKELIRNVKYIKSNFGKGHYRLEMEKEAFEQLKEKLANVNYHNNSEVRK